MGGQKYKIYINGIPVFLISTADLPASGTVEGPHTLLARYIGKPKMIKQYLDLLDKNPTLRGVTLHYPELPALWADFQACFKVLEAAGGYVLNAEGKLLVFYRRGSWDMPKGKIDPGETPEQAAVREVQEETGLGVLQLGVFLQHTYHTYPLKGKRILKRTWWYRMQTTENQVIPQTEEDIERIEWVEPAAWLASAPMVYDNIRDVITTGLSS